MRLRLPANLLAAFSTGLGALVSTAITAAEPASPSDIAAVTVMPQVTVPKPVSPLLFSSFIELAFGRTENILAEMLYDRGFEMPDSLSLNRGWCTFTKPQPEMEDWWHSGYEEHRWYLAKDKDDTRSTMERASGTWPAPPNGHFYMVVNNKSKTGAVSLAQDGLRITPGMSYQFSGLLCDGKMFSSTPASAKPVPVEVCLFPEKQLDGPPLTSATIQVDATTCRKFTVTLPAGTYSGRATFALRIGPNRRFACDMLSLMPSNSFAGLRREVLDVMKEVPAAVIRFPGGCFASTYRWRDGIGERDSRPPDFLNWWDNPLLNDFGTVEFLTLCRTVGSEPMLCVPVMFGDAENAADWVAFCNTDRHPLHHKAGITRAPMRVKYWELDNETYRRMDAITYAHRCVEFARAMKQVDPSIKVIMNCYWIYHEKLQDMLQIAGPHIDLINNRGGNIAELRGDLAELAKYNAAHKRQIGLCHSEYRANSYDLPVEAAASGDAEGLNQPKNADKQDTILAKASRWSYGLSVLCDFLNYQGFGGDFEFANFTNYTDGWGENLIDCSKTRVYPSAAGQAFAFLQRQRMAWPLACQEATPSRNLRVQAAWDIKKKTLILLALNLASQPRVVAFDISSIKGRFSPTARVETLSAPRPNVFYTEAGASPIAAEVSSLTHNDRTVSRELKPFSATVIRLSPQ
jgi:alpha-L-arabinofuranosidase